MVIKHDTISAEIRPERRMVFLKGSGVDRSNTPAMLKMCAALMAAGCEGFRLILVDLLPDGTRQNVAAQLSI